MNTYLYAVKDKENLCKKKNYILMTASGKSLFTEETMDDYAAQGYEILNTEQFRILWDERWAAYEKELCGKWKEITAKYFDDMLNCLPPMKWTRGGFFLSELYDGDIGYFYQEWHGRYYTSMQNIRSNRDIILNELHASISAGTVESISDDK